MSAFRTEFDRLCGKYNLRMSMAEAECISKLGNASSMPARVLTSRAVTQPIQKYVGTAHV